MGLNDRFEGIPTGKFAFFIGVMCLKGSAIGALSALPYAMAADVIDLDSSRTGKRQGGAYFSIWTMTRKLAYAAGLIVGTTAATIVGFNSLTDPISAPNTAYSLLWLACLYSIVPAIFKFVAMPLLWNYSLTEDKLRKFKRKLKTLRHWQHNGCPLLRLAVGLSWLIVNGGPLGLGIGSNSRLKRAR